MGYRITAMFLVACSVLGCGAALTSVSATPEAAAGGEDGIVASDAIITGEQPILSQHIIDALPEDVAFARITIARNANPDRVPVYFELFLHAKDREPTLIGSFAPYPPDREDAYLLRLPEAPQSGDRLELRMSFTEENQDPQLRIEFLPIELIDRDTASKRR